MKGLKKGMIFWHFIIKLLAILSAVMVLDSRLFCLISLMFWIQNAILVGFLRHSFLCAIWSYDSRLLHSCMFMSILCFCYQSCLFVSFCFVLVASSIYIDFVALRTANDYDLFSSVNLVLLYISQVGFQIHAELCYLFCIFMCFHSVFVYSLENNEKYSGIGVDPTLVFCISFPCMFQPLSVLDFMADSV